MNIFALIHLVYRLLSLSSDVLLKLFETTSPQKLLPSDCTGSFGQQCKLIFKQMLFSCAHIFFSKLYKFIMFGKLYNNIMFWRANKFSKIFYWGRKSTKKNIFYAFINNLEIRWILPIWIVGQIPTGHLTTISF